MSRIKKSKSGFNISKERINGGWIKKNKNEREKVKIGIT
jgi:hypothetical protein